MWTGNDNSIPLKGKDWKFDPNAKHSPNSYGATPGEPTSTAEHTTSSGKRASYGAPAPTTRHSASSASEFVQSGTDINLTPSRFDAPLQVRQQSQIQPVSEFARFEKMLRSWMWRRGVGMFLAGAFAYNAILCPIMELHPSEERCLAGLRRRRYFSEYVRLPNWFQQATGVKRKVWLFQFNQPLDDTDHDAEKLLFRNEVARAHRTKAAVEAAKFNSALPQISFGSAPLRPEDIPANVKWKSQAMIKQEREEAERRKAGKLGAAAVEETSNALLGPGGSADSLNPTRRPLSQVATQMFISLLKWVPRTFTFNRPWGDNSGNSVQYNAVFFEPVTFSAVKSSMLTVRPVEMRAPDGTRVKVRMLCQLYYRREEGHKKEVGRMKYGEAEAMVDYVAPQVCDAWLSSFADLQELIDFAPPFRKTGTKSVLNNLPLADFLAGAGEDPPEICNSLVLESPRSLDQGVAVGGNLMSQEELLRRYLAANILRRMDSKIVIDDIFWFLKVEDVKATPPEESAAFYERPNIDTGNYVL